MIQESYWCSTCGDWRDRKEITRREKGTIVGCLICDAAKNVRPEGADASSQDAATDAKSA